MPTGCSRYLPPWPLCMVCARKGLTTYWTVPYLWQGQVVVRNKYGGYWNKTRSTADSGGSSIPCMISITNISQLTDRITAHHTSSCHTGHTRLDEELGTSSCLRRWLLSQAYPFLTAKNLHYALMRMILSSHKITYAPSQGGVVTVSTTHKNIMPEFRMLAFKSM